MKTLIRNASVMLPSGMAAVSVLVDGSRIADIDPAIQISADEVIDGTGLHLMPGVVDDQVHFLRLRQCGLGHAPRA